MKRNNQRLSIDEMLKIDYPPHDKILCETSLIATDVKIGKDLYDIYILNSTRKDKSLPCICIYPAGDDSRTKFYFEVSLTHIVSDDELVLITQVDKDRHLEIYDKTKTSWNGYLQLKKKLEEFLIKPNVYTHHYTYINGLQACIGEYNAEGRTSNDFLKYCGEHKINILDKYKELVNNAANE